MLESDRGRWNIYSHEVQADRTVASDAVAVGRARDPETDARTAGKSASIPDVARCQRIQCSVSVIGYRPFLPVDDSSAVVWSPEVPVGLIRAVQAGPGVES